MDSTENKTFGEKIKNWLLTVPITVYALGSIILGLGILIIPGVIYQNIPDEIPEAMLFCISFLFLFVAGSSGVLGIIRREAFTMNIRKSIKGKWGVFWSALWVLIFYIPLLLLFITWVFSLFIK